MKKSFAACLLALPLLSACYNPVLHALYPDKKNLRQSPSPVC